jgi:hypothetical protein
LERIKMRFYERIAIALLYITVAGCESGVDISHCQDLSDAKLECEKSAYGYSCQDLSDAKLECEKSAYGYGDLGRSGR